MVEPLASKAPRSLADDRPCLESLLVYEYDRWRLSLVREEVCIIWPSIRFEILRVLQAPVCTSTSRSSDGGLGDLDDDNFVVLLRSDCRRLMVLRDCLRVRSAGVFDRRF